VLPPHIVTPLTQPMPLPPVSHAPMTASQPPPMRLVVDILAGKLLPAGWKFLRLRAAGEGEGPG